MVPMISVVISEKGGAERRESYDQHEITIGRVKGNDVLLPKGNVSKRHARLILRDGRYIVTDLKSTNGTYVNHRRITHATLVREGDRIYIGDFVLRIEGAGRDEDGAAFDEQSSDQHINVGGAIATSHPEGLLPSHQDVVSHFPIEHDPDEDSSPSVDLPGPPRVPSGLRTAAGSAPSGAGGEAPMTSEAPNYTSSPGPLSPAAISEVAPSLRSSKPDLDDRIQAQQQAHDQLVAAVEAEIGLAALETVTPDEALLARVDAALATSLEELSLPQGVDPGAVRATARLELLGLGPIGPLVEDEHVTRIQVILRHVVAYRRGHRLRPSGLGFATEAGVARAIARLAARMGVSLPATPQVDVALGDGRTLFCLRPEASPAGHLVVIERRAQSQATLDQLVRAGAISRGMATLLACCMAARANLLVTGSLDDGAGELLEALVAAAPHRTARRPNGPESDGCALWLSSRDEPAPAGVPFLPLGDERPARLAAIASAARLGCEHLVVPALRGEELARVLDAIGGGLGGVLLRATSGTLHQALHRLASELSAERPGLTVPTAREWLGACFDLGLEVTRLRDGRLRLVRIAELRRSTQGVSLRDIFTFTYHHTAAGGSVEGAFYATGIVPRIIEDLAARGMPLDTSIFRRHPSS
jgi:pilus assembly protein CpaF